MNKRRKIKAPSLVGLSPLQTRIFDAMPPDKEISSSDLIEAVYGEDKPFNSRGLLLSGIAVLSNKLEQSGEWRITKGPRIGPRPIIFKLERRR